MADEPKTTSKTSATKEKDEQERAASPAEWELSTPIAPWGGKVKYPPDPEENQPDEDEEQVEPPVTTVTLEGKEIVLEPDLQGTILSRTASAVTDHPAHLSPAYSNPAHHVPTEEEREEDQKAFDKRFPAAKQ